MIRYAYSLLAASFLMISPGTSSAEPASATSPPTPVTMRYKFKQGQVLRFRTVMDADFKVNMGETATPMPMNMHIEEKMTETVTKVNKDTGAATLSIHMDSMEMTMNGQKMPMPAQPASASSSITMSPSGKYLDSHSSLETNDPMMKEFSAGIRSFMSQLSGFFPEQAVSIGDKWNQAMTASIPGVNLKSTYNLQSLNATEAGKVATIGYTIAASGDSSKLGVKTPLPGKIMARADGTGQFLFNVDQGLLDQQTMTGNIKITFVPGKKTANTPVMMPPGPIKATGQMKLSMDRLLPDTGDSSD